jgi:hypothetical protein
MNKHSLSWRAMKKESGPFIRPLIEIGLTALGLYALMILVFVL